MSVIYDDHTKSTGLVDFYGGEKYYGEIQKQIPFGKGKLIMTDGSIYEGEFSKNGLINGKYIHFTQNSFVGKFVMDKLKCGKILFRDGDVFKGLWGVKRGKWVLVNGILYDDEENELGRFDRVSKKNEIRSKLKVLVRNDEKEGFCVKYDYFLDYDCKSYSKMVISGHGFSLTKEVKGERISIERERSFALVPYEKIDIVRENNDIKNETIYKLPYGFNISCLEKEEISSLTFDHVLGIKAEGAFDFTKKKIYFSGKIKKNGKILAKLEIKKSIFSKLSIKIDNNELRDLRSFYINLVEFTDKKKYLPLRAIVKNRASNEKNVKAMGNIIDGIKQENDCTIF